MNFFVQTCHSRLEVASWTIALIRYHLGINTQILLGVDCSSEIYDPHLTQDCIRRALRYCPNHTPIDCILTYDNHSWSDSLSSQLEEMQRKYDYTHTILFLDDFLVQEIPNPSILHKLFATASQYDLRYVSLIKKRISAIESLSRKLSKSTTSPLYLMPYDDIYYPSALQPAIWNIEYLRSQLGLVTNPWDFEKLKGNYPHYCVEENALVYTHCIEKGFLLKYNIPKPLLVAGINTSAYKDFPLTRRVVRRAKELKFAVLGYHKLW